MRLPFLVSPQAEAYICECLSREEPPEGTEPSLGLSWGIEVKDPDGAVVERFHEDHYIVGFSPPTKHIAHQHFTIAGFRLAMHPHTIESLRDKQLCIREAVVSLVPPVRRRKFLVALPVDSDATQT